MTAYKVSELLFMSLILGLAIRGGPAAGQSCPPVEAGPIWSTQDAQSKCPQICASYGSWNGAWWTTVTSEMSVCQCCVDRGATVPVEAGPIWSTDDAQSKCPGICQSHGTWDGQWRTTVWGKMSVCDCRIDQIMGHRVATESGRMGRYLWDRALAVDSPGPVAIAFHVYGPNDAHIALAEWPDDGAPLYEVVIGGWNNTQSVIRKGRQTPTQGHARVRAEENPEAVLRRGFASPFWVRVYNGLVEVGRGVHVGQSVFLRWQDPQPLRSPRYIAFSSWDQQVSYFVFKR